MRSGVALLGVLVAVLAAGTRLVPGVSPPRDPSPPEPRVGLELAGPMPIREHPGPYVSEIHLSRGNTRVTIWWKHFTNGRPFAGAGASHVEAFPTAYWPNIAHWLSDAELIVGGISPRDGATVIERWTFADTEPSVTSVLDQETGEEPSVWSTPDRTAVELVHRGDEPGRREVASLVANGGAPGRVLVRFADSGDVYDLDLEDGGLELVAGSRPPAPLVVPELADVPPRATVFGVDHPTDGHVYVYSGNGACGLLDPEGSVYLIDADRDGVLDGWRRDEELEEASRYWDPELVDRGW